MSKGRLKGGILMSYSWATPKRCTVKLKSQDSNDILSIPNMSYDTQKTSVDTYAEQANKILDIGGLAVVADENAKRVVNDTSAEED